MTRGEAVEQAHGRTDTQANTQHTHTDNKHRHRQQTVTAQTQVQAQQEQASNTQESQHTHGPAGKLEQDQIEPRYSKKRKLARGEQACKNAGHSPKNAVHKEG